MKIGINNASFFAYHGVFEEERVFGNQFNVNLEVEYPSHLFQSENLDSTINYQELYDIVKFEMANTQKLLETVAQNIISKIFENYPSVINVSVRIDKKIPQLGGPLDSTYIISEFSRK